MVVTSPQAYRPPCLSAEAAALARCFSRRRGMLGVAGFDLHVVEPPETMADPVSFALCCGDAAAAGEPRARLVMPQAVLQHLLAALDPAAPGAGPDVAALLLELQLEPLLDRLATAFPALPLYLRPGQENPEPAAFSVGLAVRDAVMAATLRLELGIEAARTFAPVLACLPDRSGTMPGLPVPLHLRVFVTDVNLSELDAARAGDVILVQAGAAEELLLVAGERFVWRARREGSRVRLLSPRLNPVAVGLGDWLMGNEISVEDASGLDELPVRLAFEIGRMELPLSELAVLGPGHVFELARDEAQPIDILANGRRVGQGRIVSVAGTLGVQIVRIGRV